MGLTLFRHQQNGGKAERPSGSLACFSDSKRKSLYRNNNQHSSSTNSNGNDNDNHIEKKAASIVTIVSSKRPKASNQSSCLLLAGALVRRADVHDAVSINVEGHLYN